MYLVHLNQEGVEEGEGGWDCIQDGTKDESILMMT